MATDTVRERIIAAIVTRLASAVTSKGFNLSLGTNVNRAIMNVDPDKVPFFNVLPLSETVTQLQSVNQATMVVKVEGAAEHGSTNASKIAEQILGDLIEILTATTWTLAFTSGGTFTPLVGHTIAGNVSAATAFIEAITVSSGSWAAGNAAGTFTLRRLTGLFQAETLKIGTNLDVATIAGAPSGSKAITAATAGLAESILYVEGGPTEYPAEGNLLTGCSAFFRVIYTTRVGDPYNKP